MEGRVNIGVAGSRDYFDLDLVTDAVRAHWGVDLDLLVSGGARGVDHTAEQAAHDLFVPVLSFRPRLQHTEWRIERLLFGADGTVDRAWLPGAYPSFAAAAFVRNGYIVESSDRMLVFWDGKSRGTEDTLRKAQAKLGTGRVDILLDRRQRARH